MVISASSNLYQQNNIDNNPVDVTASDYAIGLLSLRKGGDLGLFI